ncbi:hypothetical protein BGZ74_001749 [Mortierella antarctica]|nr:hypothetical protein BGZ74_001749 [Mortierella antarctica]
MDGALNDIAGYIHNETMVDPVTKRQLVAAYGDSQMLLLIIAMCMAVFVCIATAFMQHVDLREYDDTEKTVDGPAEDVEGKI